MPFSHLDETGRGRMVDVSQKESTLRSAVAAGRIRMCAAAREAVRGQTVKKGDVLGVAQIAAVLAAKRTADIVPLCHPLALTAVEPRFSWTDDGLEIAVTVRTHAPTGVEMEALTAVTGALLAVYDMVKGIDRGMQITDIRLLEKEGGRSGRYERSSPRIVAVHRSKEKGTVKTPIEVGVFSPEHGLEGDAHAGAWHRQVSLLGIESYERLPREDGSLWPTGSMAENLTTEGVELFSLPVGTVLFVGDVALEITQIGKECHVGCAIRTQTGDCVMPREGIFARVLVGGEIRPGDPMHVCYRPETKK